MKLKALDSFYSDETKAVSAKQEFDVDSDALGADLIKRGLAVAVDDGAKAEQPAPKNKDAGAAPQNKGARDPLDHDGDGRKGGSLPKEPKA